jgi:hypothetical protein
MEATKESIPQESVIKKGDKSASAWLVALAQNDCQELFKGQFGASQALVDGVPIPLDGSAHPWLRKPQ